MESGTLYLSVGRDYRVHGKYEFVVYRGEDIVARKGMFTSSSQAKRAGLKAAQAFQSAEG